MTISNNNNTKLQSTAWHQVPKNYYYVRRGRQRGKGKRESLNDKKWLPRRSWRTRGSTEYPKSILGIHYVSPLGASSAFKSSRDHRRFLAVCKFFQLGNLQGDVDQRLQLHLNHPGDYWKSQHLLYWIYLCVCGGIFFLVTVDVDANRSATATCSWQTVD